MEAKEVIVAQAVANAELMAERDNLRGQLLNALQENERLTAAAADKAAEQKPSKRS